MPCLTEDRGLRARRSSDRFVFITSLVSLAEAPDGRALQRPGGEMYFEIQSRTIGGLVESFLTVPGSSLGSESLSVFRVSQALGPTPASGSSLQALRLVDYHRCCCIVL